MRNNQVQHTLQAMGRHIHDHMTARELSQNHMAQLVGVTNPTFSRMAFPDRQGADGVSVANWFAALQVTGKLNELVKRFERQAGKIIVSASPEAFVSIGALDSDLDAPEVDHYLVMEALMRVGEALKTVIPLVPPGSIRQLSKRMGVVAPTLTSLLTPTPDRSGGTAMRHLIVASDITGLDDAFHHTFKSAPRPAPVAVSRQRERELNVSPSI